MGEAIPQTLRAQLQDALNKLGDDPAQYFRTAGIKGIKCSAGYCPVANYLRTELSTEVISVGTSIASAYRNLVEANADLPLRVRYFIYHFDKDAYPDLVQI